MLLRLRSLMSQLGGFCVVLIECGHLDQLCISNVHFPSWWKIVSVHLLYIYDFLLTGACEACRGGLRSDSASRADFKPPARKGNPKKCSIYLPF